MKIKVLLFAHLQEEAGQGEMELELQGNTVKDLMAVMEEEYRLTRLPQAMVAVNEEFADAETVLKEGDSVAILPPVSGG
ncbi:molybdopterin converting factor subunit 1 [Falsibacillus pallidus]|uniref:molybdopterin converting factor subunit 1 n=1 Tax=Falsibacillus pallidus TaxID=493781 RepID=UPI003D954D98